MKIPQDNKRIIVTNGKEAFGGTIAYTKNINLDDEGFFTLSAPMVKIFSEETAEGGDANMDISTTIFPYDSGKYKFLTSNKVFNLFMTDLSVTEDTGIATTLDTSRVVSWKDGNWFINADDVYDYTGATGNGVYTSRINQLLDYIELFTNRNTLVGSTGSVVKQYNESFANTTDLTLPDNFNIEGIAYSNNQVGIITRQSKNQGDAYFFTWNGKTAEASSGYPLNDSYLASVDAYLSSWVLFTSSGELLYFNGGGFEQLGTLPQFSTDDDFVSLTPSTSITIGENIDVDGELVFVNSPSLPEQSRKGDPYKPFASGGVYCYDPKNSFYHRHAPSYSRYLSETGTASSNVVTLGTHYLETGDELYTDSASAGLSAQTVYYAIRISETTIKIASTYENALADTELTLTDGSITFFYKQTRDFGEESVRLVDVGVSKVYRDYEGFSSSGILPFFMGCKIRPNDVSNNVVSVLNALAPKMSNRGYLVSSRFQTNSISDKWQTIAVKYDDLTPQSSIIVKANTKSSKPLVIGDSSLYDGSYTGDSITWDANGKTFETTFDLTKAEEGDEVHVFSGAGAGQSAHIVELSNNGTVWTVLLDEKLRGIRSGTKSCVVVSKYKKIGTITADDTDGFKEFAIDQANSPKVEVKLELRGIDVRVSEFQVINEAGEPSIA